ncbi:hypothetical protein I4U23_003229 [Adineta vaga]|nr:hypothetical protein I4U23_003229 [Adineta vaga]
MSQPSNHVSSLKLNQISTCRQDDKFIFKWPEDNRRPGKPDFVDLSIDVKGFYLICLNKHTKKTECFDLALIHDARTGKQVTLPPDAEDCPELQYGGILTSRWLTIYYGNTFVPTQNFRIIHFAFQYSTTASEWAGRLFQYGHNQLLRNLSSLDCLEKIHSKIYHELLDRDKGIIPVRGLIQFLSENHRDNSRERRICGALEALKLPHTVKSNIDKAQFNFDMFFRFYMYLMDRQEIDTFDEKSQECLSWEDLNEFMKKQNDDIDGPFEMELCEEKAKDLINKYAQSDEKFDKKKMSKEGFLRYLLSFDNFIVDPAKFDLFMDMNKPLTHYFIASSHNTYLTGVQWSGRASVEMYRQVLLAGCRCIELDVVDSDDKSDIPEIKHIYTRVKPVPLTDVVAAIRDYAFKVSPYPLILSIENHCNPRAQAAMAKIFIEFFGDQLLTESLPSHPCEANYPLPSPNDLRYKILIKNKKLPSQSTTTTTTKVNNPNTRSIIAVSNSDPSTQKTKTLPSSVHSPYSKSSSADSLQTVHLTELNRRYGMVLDDENLSYEGAGISQMELDGIISSATETLPESRATKEMSHLVIYTVPVPFKTFVHARGLNRSYEMSSFSEDQATSLIRDRARDFLEYNQRQFSRIYPRGMRFDSNNFDPYLYWPIGCQLVALNYQTLDVNMQINLGIFSFNNACGYIEKPAKLCEPYGLFDPRIQNNSEDVFSYDIDLKVLSGQFLCQNHEPPVVNIRIYGTYGSSTKQQEYHLRAELWNGFQAIYDTNSDVHSQKYPIQFTKIILPEMAAIRFDVTSVDGALVGQCFIPVSHLRSGYRHVVLRNEINIPVRSASLFIYVRKTFQFNLKKQKPKIPNENANINPDGFFSNVVRRYPNSLRSDKKENLAIPLEETNWYQKHVLASSEFNDTKRLCKIYSLNDNKQKKISERDEAINRRLRSISADYKKKIQKAETNLVEYNATQSESRQRSQLTSSTLNRNDSDASQCLLNIYIDKFRQQESAETERLIKFYSEIKRKIKANYNEQCGELQRILEKEISQVNNNVRFQKKQELTAIKSTEKDRTKRSLLEQKSMRMNSECGALTIHKLNEMYGKTKDELEANFPINLKQVEEEERSELTKCSEKYKRKLNTIKYQLEYRLYKTGNGTVSYDDLPSIVHHTRMTTTTSLSTDDDDLLKEVLQSNE